MKSRQSVLTIMPATHCKKVSKQNVQKSISILAIKHLMSNWRDDRTLVMVTIRRARASLKIRSSRKRTGFTGRRNTREVSSKRDATVTATST